MARPDPENVRAHFGYLADQVRVFEDRHLQVFLFCVTGSAGIIAIPQEVVSKLAPWIAIALLNAVGLFLMRRLHIWANDHYQVLKDVFGELELPTQFDVFSRLDKTKLPFGTRHTMQAVTVLLVVVGVAMVITVGVGLDLQEAATP